MTGLVVTALWLGGLYLAAAVMLVRAELRARRDAEVWTARDDAALTALLRRGWM